MRGFEDQSRSIENNKIEADEDQQERIRFDEVFGVDKERDADQIKRKMKLIRKDPRIGRISSKRDYERDKKDDLLKYSDEEVESGQWDEGDLNFVIEKLQEERRDEYFKNVADKYEQTRPVSDSIVRLDQEAEIVKQLRENTPVLIRGIPRTGKTSMGRSIKTHYFGRENSIFIDVVTQESAGSSKSPENFKKHFGEHAITRFIAERELPKAELEDIFNRKDEIIKLIEKSQKSPFEFLNNYLLQKGEKIFLFLDEAIGLAEQQKKMEHLAGLKDLSQVQLAIVLHRFASLEDSFKEIFEGYKTHFVRSLTIEEVGALVRKPLEGTEITFTGDAIQRIFEFTGGRPMEINNLCWALMHPISKDKNYKFTYRAKDIDELTSKEVWELKKSFSVAIDTYNRAYDVSMSNEERAIIDKLIKEGEVPVSEINVDTVQPLIDTTLVTKDESKEIYRINGVLFEKVISERLERLERDS